MSSNHAPYKQGVFKPVNKDKYRGSQPIFFRSSLELEFMRYCDCGSAVVEWGSESIIVQYKDPTRGNSVHRYFVDFVMKIKDKHGEMHKFWIEIKPSSQTTLPKKGRKSEKTYMEAVYTFARNQAKWTAAVAEAKRNNAKFKLITELDLKGGR